MSPFRSGRRPALHYAVPDDSQRKQGFCPRRQKRKTLAGRSFCCSACASSAGDFCFHSPEIRHTRSISFPDTSRCWLLSRCNLFHQLYSAWSSVRAGAHREKLARTGSAAESWAESLDSLLRTRPRGTKIHTLDLDFVHTFDRIFMGKGRFSLRTTRLRPALGPGNPIVRSQRIYIAWKMNPYRLRCFSLAARTRIRKKSLCAHN